LKITTRLNLFALAAILVMTAAIVLAAESFLEAELLHSRVRLMQGKLENATQSIRQQQNRGGFRDGHAFHRRAHRQPHRLPPRGQGG
jgi:hypothetical protein